MEQHKCCDKMSVDDAQNDRMDRLDLRLRAVEEVVIELRTLTKLVKPIILMAAAGLGIDIMPMVT
jgi:hypothetical protein